ncbi:5,10-methylenetetrahydrofolate reductase [Gammaproteobacteria bacterium]
MQSQQRHPRVFSFEFFPPKNEESAEKLRQIRDELALLGPRFFSVTYGAGGSTRDRTIKAVLDIQNAGHEAAPHLSCIGSTREGIRDILNEYRMCGIRHIVALRGDLPSGTHDVGELRYANELVEFIRTETGDHFHIEVAAYPEFHPQASLAITDLKNFKRKVQSGANSAITQYFYNADAYLRFVESCERMGLDIPIVPGIMPITNFTQLVRFSDLCGAEVPRWLRRRLEGYGDDLDAIRAFGLEVVIELCRRLLDAGAPGLHFYTMNQSAPTKAIWRALNLNVS